MKRTELLQELRMMRFEEAFTRADNSTGSRKQRRRGYWVCERTFRRPIDRYEEAGLE